MYNEGRKGARDETLVTRQRCLRSRDTTVMVKLYLYGWRYILPGPHLSVY